MRNFSGKENGFTILEIVIYMSATAMLTVFMMTYLVNIWERFHYIENVRNVQYGAHTLMNHIVRDVRNAQSVNIISANELSLIRADGTEVHYVWDNSPGEYSVLIDDGITTYTVSNNIKVSNLSFGNGVNSDVITVNLTAGQNTDKANVSPYSLSLSSQAISRRAVY